MHPKNRFRRLLAVGSAMSIVLLAPTLRAVDKPADADNTARNARDKNGNTLTAGDQGKTPTDIKVTQQIRKQVVAAKELSTNAHNVKIITIEGKVTLRGPVKTENEKRLIGEIATRVAGAMERVDNQLEVKTN